LDIYVHQMAGYDPAALSRQLRSAFPTACVGGCSTAGEIAEGKMITGSVTVLALDGDIVSDAQEEMSGWQKIGAILQGIGSASVPLVQAAIDGHKEKIRAL